MLCYAMSVYVYTTACSTVTWILGWRYWNSSFQRQKTCRTCKIL